jgi:hypothetical protein
MSTARIVVGSVLFVGALVFLAPSRLVTPDIQAAEQYFGCPTGYTFQTKSTGARCYLAGTTSTENIVCGLGYVKAIDQFNGGRDACQNQVSNVVGNYTCPSGFSPKVQPGPDFCTKTTNPSIIAPAVSKSL